MRTTALLTLGLLLAAAPAAFAGGDHAKSGKCHGDLNAEAADIASHGWLGLETEKDASGGWVVRSVAAGSPAEKAGFQKGDVLVALAGVRLSEQNMEAVKKVKQGLAPGKQVSYTVRRAGAERNLAATLAPVPREVLAQRLGEHVLDAHLTTEVAAKN